MSAPRAPWVPLARGALGLCALAALVLSLHKFGTLDELARAITSHGLIDANLVPAAAWCAASAEALAGVIALCSLALTRRVMFAAYLLGIWLFATGLYLLFVSGSPPPAPTSCGCGFGKLVPPEGWTLLAIRNFASAILVLLLGLVGRHSPPSAQGAANSSPSNP